MMLDFAVDQEDTDLFGQLASGYAALADHGAYNDGLIPWAFSVEGGNLVVVDSGSALDADFMCVGGLIKGLKLGLWDRYMEKRDKVRLEQRMRNIEVDDNYKVLDLKRVIEKAIKGFSDHNIIPKQNMPTSRIQLLNSGERRTLYRSATLALRGASISETKASVDQLKDDLMFSPGNHWGLTDEVFKNSMNAKFYDYLDYSNLMYVLGYAQENIKDLDTTRLQQAAVNYVSYVAQNVDDAATNESTPDNSASLVRQLLYLGSYLSDPEASAGGSGYDSETVLKGFKSSAAALLSKVLKSGESKGSVKMTYDANAGWFGNNGVKIMGDNNQFATLGAYLVALYGLRSQKSYTDYSEQEVSDKIATTEKILAAYLGANGGAGDDGNSMMSKLDSAVQARSPWSNGCYFDLMLFAKSWATVAREKSGARVGAVVA